MDKCKTSQSFGVFSLHPYVGDFQRMTYHSYSEDIMASGQKTMLEVAC